MGTIQGSTSKYSRFQRWVDHVIVVLGTKVPGYYGNQITQKLNIHIESIYYVNAEKKVNCGNFSFCII
jgi:hypothetical protein